MAFPPFREFGFEYSAPAKGCKPSAFAVSRIDVESFAGLENDFTHWLHHFFRLGLGALTLTQVNHFLGWRFRSRLGAPEGLVLRTHRLFGPVLESLHGIGSLIGFRFYWAEVFALHQATNCSAAPALKKTWDPRSL
jgi:hypothetical protein